MRREARDRHGSDEMTKQVQRLRPAWLRGLAAIAVIAVQVACSGSETGSHAETRSKESAAPLQNPAMAPNGMAAMHADAGASDTTPVAGPGMGLFAVKAQRFDRICPTVLAGADGYPIVVCLSPVDGTTLYLLDPQTAEVLASHNLPGEILLTVEGKNHLGGAYAYVDQADRVVTVDARNTLLRIAHQRNADGSWSFVELEPQALTAALDADCGQPGCNGVNSVAPDWRGHLWFATGNATVGVVDPRGAVATLSLPDEKVANSIATSPEGTAVVTSHALYLLSLDHDGQPVIVWRQAYDRGVGRKPGQLSWGSGTTPTFFGPRRGSEYLAIVDNAEPHANLRVFDSRSGRPICSVPVLADSTSHSGTEISPIGFDRSLYVMNTYGYVFPVWVSETTEMRPPVAPYVGGMARIDVREDGSGCDPVWSNKVAIVGAPRLSLADGLLYAVAETSPLSDAIVTPVDPYEFTVVDSGTGEVRSRQALNLTDVFDPITINLVINHDGVAYQGTVGGLLRISGPASR